MSAAVIVHPAYVARMSLHQFVVWAERHNLIASNVRAASGNHYLMLERIKAVA